MTAPVETPQEDDTDRHRAVHMYCVCQQDGPPMTALCGHVKTDPIRRISFHIPPEVCVVCDDLYMAMAMCPICGRPHR